MPVTKRGQSYQGQVNYKGARYRRNFDTLIEAEQWCVDAKAALLAGRMPDMGERASTSEGDGRPRTLRQLADVVSQRHWSKQRSSVTLIRNMDSVCSVLGPDTDINKIDINMVDKLKQELAKLGNAPGTVNRKLAALSKALRFGFERGWVRQVPKIEREREGKGRMRFIEPEEERQMLAYFAHVGFDDMVDFCIVAIDTGLRVGEILRLRAADCREVITVWESKSDKPRSVPMTDRVREVLTRRKKDRIGLLFPDLNQWSITHAWRRMKSHLGLDDDKQFVPHVMRHTFCSRLAMAGVNAKLIMDLAGHCNLTVTQRYMTLAPSDLANAVSKLSQFQMSAMETKVS